MKNLFLSALMGMTLVGCGVSEQGSETSATPAFVQIEEGEFMMFPDSSHQLDSCDIYTNLELKNTKSGPVAELTNRLHGFCEIYVEPNPRAYALRVTDAGCGSLKYTSRETVHKSLIPRLEIVDHRPRICRDLQPNDLVMQEYVDGDFLKTYSLGRQDAQLK